MSTASTSTALQRRQAANRTKHSTRAAQQRAAQTSRPSTGLVHRPLTMVTPSGAGIRRTKAKMTGAQKNAQGRTSEWNRSPYYVDAVTVDVRWSK